MQSTKIENLRLRQFLRPFITYVHYISELPPRRSITLHAWVLYLLGPACSGQLALQVEATMPGQSCWLSLSLSRLLLHHKPTKVVSDELYEYGEAIAVLYCLFDGHVPMEQNGFSSNIGQQGLQALAWSL